MAGVVLLLAFVGVRGRGAPTGLVLTTRGLRVSRGRDQFTVPAAALRDFAVVPLPAPRRLPSAKGLKLLKVRADPVAVAGAPGHVGSLKDAERPDELRLVVVGDAHVPGTAGGPGLRPPPRSGRVGRPAPARLKFSAKIGPAAGQDAH